MVFEDSAEQEMCLGYNVRSPEVVVLRPLAEPRAREDVYLTGIHAPADESDIKGIVVQVYEDEPAPPTLPDGDIPRKGAHYSSHILAGFFRPDSGSFPCSDKRMKSSGRRGDSLWLQGEPRFIGSY